jgi:hypothetical protein
MGKKHNILHKIIIVTGDNATNNNTLYRYLHERLSRKYDEFLSPIGIRDKEMRFMGDYSQIRCFAHILNLVCKDILKNLGSSTHKEAVTFLDRVKGKWQKITLLLGQGEITLLRIIILWISRSPQRLQEWDKRKNTKKRIPYDVDNRWNYTNRIIEDSFTNQAALEDTIKDHQELGDARLTAAH